MKTYLNLIAVLLVVFVNSSNAAPRRGSIDRPSVDKEDRQPHSNVSIWREGPAGVFQGMWNTPTSGNTTEWIRKLTVWYDDGIRGIKLRVVGGNGERDLPEVGFKVGNPHEILFTGDETIVRAFGVLDGENLRELQVWYIALAHSDPGFFPNGRIKHWETPGWRADIKPNIRFDSLYTQQQGYPFEEAVGFQMLFNPKTKRAVGFGVLFQQTPLLRIEPVAAVWPVNGGAIFGPVGQRATQAGGKDPSVRELVVWSSSDKSRITGIEAHGWVRGEARRFGRAEGERETVSLSRNHAIDLVLVGMQNGYVRTLEIRAIPVRRKDSNETPPPKSWNARTGYTTTPSAVFANGYGPDLRLISEFIGFCGDVDDSGLRSLGVIRMPAPDYSFEPREHPNYEKKIGKP